LPISLHFICHFICGIGLSYPHLQLNAAQSHFRKDLAWKNPKAIVLFSSLSSYLGFTVSCQDVLSLVVCEMESERESEEERKSKWSKPST